MAIISITSRFILLNFMFLLCFFKVGSSNDDNPGRTVKTDKKVTWTQCKCFNFRKIKIKVRQIPLCITCHIPTTYPPPTYQYHLPTTYLLPTYQLPNTYLPPIVPVTYLPPICHLPDTFLLPTMHVELRIFCDAKKNICQDFCYYKKKYFIKLVHNTY